MRHLEEDLSAYISGELAEEKRREVEAHLKECESCSREFVRLQDLEALLKGSESREPSARFTETVLQAVKQTPQTRSQKNWKRAAWLALAASVAVVILALNLYRKNQPSVVPAGPSVVVVPKKQEQPQVVKKEEPKNPVSNPPAPKTETKPTLSPEIAKNETPLSTEDVDIIANLDTLENMDLIMNYDDVNHMETAVVANEEGKAQ